MNSALRMSLVLALALVTASTSAWARGGQGQDAGGGDRRGGCAPGLTVIGTQGEKRVFSAQADFFRVYPSREIDQGEQPRPAVRLEAMLAEQKATWVNVVDCDNRSRPLPVGLPVEGAIYFVLTGRNTIKVVRETRPGQFRNLIGSVQELKFRSSLPGQDRSKP